MPATSTNCTAADCHASVGTDHHALHNTTGVVDSGCSGCHFTYLDDEHGKLGFTCATCHSSTNSAVMTAIATNQLTCSACHPAVNGRDRHLAQDTLEFVSGNAGGHRVDASLPWSKTSFVVSGTTYTWPLPTGFLQTGWTTTSIVSCDRCHTFSGSAEGPHGAAVNVNIDPAYSASWQSTRLASIPSGLLCNKCHQNIGSMNGVHNERAHYGSYCVDCHAKIPHGWRVPRLLAYTTDPIPYRSNHLTGIKLRSYTPGNWDESDCGQSGCWEHNSSVTPKWPSVTQAPNGTVMGTVRTSAGIAIPGATVAVTGGGSATTNASGAYSISLPAGTYTLTASASGYTAQAKTVTVVSAQAAPLDFSLSAAPTVGAVSGTVTDATTSAAVSDATVTIGTRTAATASNGTYLVTDLATGNYTITIAKAGYTTYSANLSVTAGSTTTHNVSLVPASAVNLALGKSFSASHYESSYYAPGKAGDGSTSTRWWSNNNGYSGTTEWLSVNLASTFNISRVEVAWYSTYYASEFRVYTSMDGSTWTQVYSTTSGTSGTSTVTFSSRNARYVQLECRRTGGGRNTGYGVAEM
ncbi:PEGA domain-containing protein, partial [bacterium]|nr:PEGA domain-containing protein [bacterium]